LSNTTTTPAPSTGISIGVATTLAGGEWFSAATFVITAQMLYEHGWKGGILNDKKRQVLLNLICLICCLNTTISYGFNATRQAVWVSDLTTMITFISVQYGLVILNHNSIIRISNLISGARMDRKTIDRYCYLLYLLPWVVFIPIYYAIQTKWEVCNPFTFQPAGCVPSPFNTSPYNGNIYKPLNIALIFGTEGIAALTDIFLLVKVINQRKELDSAKETTAISTDLMMSYGLTWLLIAIDILIKSLNAAGQPLLFDSIISICTIATRSRANLQFGLELQTIFKGTTQNNRSGGSMTKMESKMSPVSML
jgi:hypothetical protein